MPRSCWGSARLPLWPIQTSGPLHPSPPLQNPQPNPIFRLRSCPALPEHLAVSFYPALQASEETGLFCAWQSLIWLQKWKWSHGSSLGEAGVHRDQAQVKELGGGGSASEGEPGGGGWVAGGGEGGGLVGVSILKTQWWASVTPPYTYPHTHVHTSSPSTSPPHPAPPPQHLIAHVMSCSEWDYLCGGTWGPCALGAPPAGPHLQGIHLGWCFLWSAGAKTSALLAASGLVALGPPQPPLPPPPSHPLGAFCFLNYSLQRGGLRFETCGGGWGLALTHEAPEHPGAWDVSLWQDTCYFSVLDQLRPLASNHTLTNQRGK